MPSAGYHGPTKLEWEVKDGAIHVGYKEWNIQRTSSIIPVDAIVAALREGSPKAEKTVLVRLNEALAAKTVANVEIDRLQRVLAAARSDTLAEAKHWVTIWATHFAHKQDIAEALLEVAKKIPNIGKPADRSEAAIDNHTVAIFDESSL
jgi:hypothetical protein